MNTPLHIDPALYDRAVEECMEAHNRGNPVHAGVLAMSAGVDAGVMGLSISDCPQAIVGRHELYQRYLWGRNVARTTNENNKQLGLI